MDVLSVRGALISGVGAVVAGVGRAVFGLATAEEEPPHATAAKRRHKMAGKR